GEVTENGIRLQELRPHRSAAGGNRLRALDAGRCAAPGLRVRAVAARVIAALTCCAAAAAIRGSVLHEGLVGTFDSARAARVRASAVARHFYLLVGWKGEAPGGCAALRVASSDPRASAADEENERQDQADHK